VVEIMSRLKHLKARYIADRLSQMAYQRRNPDAPWITPVMVDILDQWLRPTDCGVEWGSGHSTIWLARRLGRLDSVEESADWHRTVQSLLARHCFTGKVNLHLVPILAKDRSACCPYVAVAARIASNSLDFALIDGDLRDHCAALAVQLLKPGGLLVIDNIERYLPRKTPTRSPNSRREQDGYPSQVWERLHEELSRWRSIWTTDGVSDTAMWVKP
jgi:predicted O-methyltransferase YrrM